MVGPLGLVCRHADDGGIDDIVGVARVCRDEEGGMCARASPLLDEVDFVALDALATGKDGGVGVVLEVASGD